MTADCVYHGAEMVGGDLWAEWASSFEHCKSICLGNSVCKKWTYYIADNLKWCHLKRQAPTRVSKKRQAMTSVSICNNCISGIKNSSTHHCNKDCKFDIVF